MSGDKKSEFNMAALSIQRLSDLQAKANDLSIEARLKANRREDSFRTIFEYLTTLKRINVEIAAIIKKASYEDHKTAINNLLVSTSNATGDQQLEVLDQLDDLNADLLRAAQAGGLLYPVYIAYGTEEKFDNYLGNTTV